jgi:hypothetical protein
VEGSTTWSAALHQTFRLLPEPSEHVRPFLESDGRTPEEVLAALPYEPKRAGAAPGAGPDPRRYRDGKHVYQMVGLLYEDEGVVRVTELGKTVLRWLEILNPANAPVLGAYAAYGLAACQLRNSTRAGGGYADSVVVFPFNFIWRAMLALDDKISSEELNRAIFKVTSAAELDEAVDAIATARWADDETLLGNQVITGPRRNDRVVPWISLASFGYTLIADKSEDSERRYYRIRRGTKPVVDRAARIRLRHQEFGSVPEYVEYLSKMAGLPPILSAPAGAREEAAS